MVQVLNFLLFQWLFFRVRYVPRSFPDGRVARVEFWFVVVPLTGWVTPFVALGLWERNRFTQ
jgi:hypothetical protein